MNNKMIICMGAGFEAALYYQPTNSDKRSVMWATHNLPIRKIMKYFISSRGRMGLSMENIHAIEARLRARDYVIHTWGNPGKIQVYIDIRP